MVVSAVFFLSMLLLGRPGTTSAEPHPNANLVNVVATFNTTNDEKDYDTTVWVKVYNNGEMIAWCYDPSSHTYDDWSNYVLPVTAKNGALVPIEYKDVNNLNVKISSQASEGDLPLGVPFGIGNDRWKFYADVVLTFSDGTRIGLRSPNEIVLNSTWENVVTSTEQFERYDPEEAEKASKRAHRK